MIATKEECLISSQNGYDSRNRYLYSIFATAASAAALGRLLAGCLCIINKAGASGNYGTVPYSYEEHLVLLVLRIAKAEGGSYRYSYRTVGRSVDPSTPAEPWLSPGRALLAEPLSSDPTNKLCFLML